MRNFISRVKFSSFELVVFLCSNENLQLQEKSWKIKCRKILLILFQSVPYGLTFL